MAKSNYILSYQASVIYETVVGGKQGIEVFENGESRFIETTLNQCMAYNENYYGTNLNVSKQLMKDIIGSGHAAPYMFGEMIWVPLVTRNRPDTIYVALHHFNGLSTCLNGEIKLLLSNGTDIKLNISEASVIRRLGGASLVKNLIESRRNPYNNPNNQAASTWEIVKEEGNVYFTRKKKE